MRQRGTAGIGLAAVVLAVLMTIPGFAQRSELGELKIANLGSCALTSGKVIQDCRIGYRTFGTLNGAKDNAVVMPSWLNGRSEDLTSLMSATPDAMTLIDTSKFYGIAFDSLGDGVSSSPSNSPKQPGPEFPVFTLEDSATAEYRALTEVLGLKHIHAAVGLSMGGHQVFALATMYPKFMDEAVPIVGSPQPTPFDQLSKQLTKDAIEADPAWMGGRYTSEPPLKLANALGALMVSAPAYRNSQTTRDKFPAWLAELEAPQRQDANDRIAQLDAILGHDVLRGRSIEEAAKDTPVKFLVINAAEDRMVTPAPALAWAKAIGAETYLSPGACAHLIMNCDAGAVSSRVRRFLAQ